MEEIGLFDDRVGAGEDQKSLEEPARPGNDVYGDERNYGNANQHEQQLQAAAPAVRADAKLALNPVYLATPTDATS